MENGDAVFDRVMESINDDGKFQRRFSIIYNLLFVTVCSMPYMSLVLVMATPGHWCYIPGRENTNYSLNEWKEMHLPRDPVQLDNFASCKMYNHSSLGHKFNGTEEEIICQYGYEYDQTWYTNTIPSTQNWVCDKETYIMSLFSATTIGEVIGAFTLGQLGDYLGRRPIYLIANLLTLATKLLGLFTYVNFYAFMITCAIASFPSLTAAQSALAISMEITKPENRAALAQIQNYGWCLSMIIMSLVCWAIPRWMIFIIIITLPMTIYVFTYRSFIESPRWLAARGRTDECIRELEKIAKVNGRKLQPEMIENLKHHTTEPETIYGLLSVVSSLRLAKNTIVLTFVLIVYTMCYGIFLLNTTNLGGNPFLQFLWQSVIELPGYILGKYLCDKIGRRFTGSSAYVFATAMFIPVLITIRDKKAAFVTNCFILLAKFCLSVTYYTQTLQTMEIYPTCLRQTGMSLGIVIAGLFGIVVPYIIYLGTIYDARYPYILMMMLTFIAAVAQIFLPETLYVKLPETLQEARVFGKDQKFFSLPKKIEIEIVKYEEDMAFIKRKIETQ